MQTLLYLEHIDKILTKTFPRIEQLCCESDYPQGLKTGFKDLDELTAGLQPATLTVIGARPAMGKTALLLTILHNIAFDSECGTNNAIAFFSPDTPAQPLTERLLCLDANVCTNKLHKGDLRETEWKALWKSCERLKSSNLYINDTNILSTSTIRTQLQDLAKSQTIDVIAIDSLQSLNPSCPKTNRNDELEEIARELKAISIEFNAPVIVTTQLDRALEARQYKHPLLSDVGTSDHIVNVSDLVLLLYREDYYFSDTENQNIAELRLAKNRLGPTTTLFLFFQKETGKFRCLSFDKNR